MILHVLLKTTLLLLFVTSLQAQISAFNYTSVLNEGPSRVGFRQQNNNKNFFFSPPQNRGAPYTQIFTVCHGLLWLYMNEPLGFKLSLKIECEII